MLNGISVSVDCERCGRTFIADRDETGMPDSTTCLECACDCRMECPECGSDDFNTSVYDWGTDPETGYSDSGVAGCCQKCGHSADIEDFQACRSCLVHGRR